MKEARFAAIILAAGEGTRLNSAIPKVLHEIAGQPMIRHVLGALRPPDPGPYGRFVLDRDGTLARIVEARDATPEEREIGLCNGGIMAIDARHLFELVDQIGNDNAKREYYLTDIVAIARAAGLSCRA